MDIFQSYPAELRAKECEAIRHRRGALGSIQLAASSAGSGKSFTAGPDSADLPPDTVGVALSGGGIRSATFCLGVIQAMAKLGLVRRIDLLSTVSGGGYIGSFLGRFFDRLRGSPVAPADVVEGALSDPQSDELRWLRRHGNYIAPDGKSDLHIDLAVFIRNFLTLHLVVGLLVFAAFGLANVVRYGLLEQVSALVPYVGAFSWEEMPIGHIIMGGLGAFWSPWFMLFELVLLVFVIPHMIGYWLSSPDDPERYHGPTLLLNFLAFGVLLWLGVRDGLQVPLVLSAVPFLAAFGVIELAWLRVRKTAAAVGTGGKPVERLRTRNYLTRDLAVWLMFTAGLLGFALIDTGAHAIFEAYTRQNATYVKAFAQLGAGLAALLPVLQFLAKFISQRQSRRGNPTPLTRWLTRPALSCVFAGVLMVPPLILVCYASHAAFGGGGTFTKGFWWTIAGLIFSLILAHPKSISFINRSSLNQTYAARLARAYLGASNPLRRSSLGRNIDEVMPDDDTDSLRDYRPFEAGGPVHIIGTCVNETLDPFTQREVRDRQGTGLAISSIGMSIGADWHALWENEGEYPISPVGHTPGTLHPLLDINGRPPVRRRPGRVKQEGLEELPLRQWMSISGAAFGSGLGQYTTRALSLLFTLANLRTGYWWDSGLSSADRGARPQVSFLRRLIWLLPKLFVTQSRLLDEALARFPGPWWRFWYLSDGGQFENLGAYELIRRQVPFIVVADAGADPDYNFEDFANLQRKVRIDFQAHLELFTDTDWDAALANYLSQLRANGEDDASIATKQSDWTNYFGPIRDSLARPGLYGGTFDDLRPSFDADDNVTKPSRKHGALFKVTYQNGTQGSLLLYLKATLTGDEPSDLHHYHLENRDFPHESPADQFFDEAQWESYRRLGEHIGRGLLTPGPVSDKNLEGLIWLTLLRA